MNGLTHGGLHQVHVSYHLGGERISDMLMEFSILQIICKQNHLDLEVGTIRTDHLYGGSHWVSGREGRSPTCRCAGGRARSPCPRQTGTRTARCALPASRWTRQMPRNQIKLWKLYQQYEFEFRSKRSKKYYLIKMTFNFKTEKYINPNLIEDCKINRHANS